MIFDLSGRRIWVAGHRGMVGSALVRRLERENCTILTVGREDVDLLDGAAVRSWIASNRPDAIILAAAKVGGILANDSYPATFLYDNLMIAANVIDAAHKVDVDRLLFLGSSCIYPKFAPQPINEDALLTGPLEPTNEWYAVAKIAGIKLTQAYRKQYGRDYISAMPTNLYGPGDNFDLALSHVIPALIRKFHEAKVNEQDVVTVWGTGTPLREFLHVDDCADACILLLKHYSEASQINVGSGEDQSIADIAGLIAEVTGFQGDVRFDTTMPDGTPRKLMSAARLRGLGWSPNIPLRDGLSRTYAWYLDQVAHD